MKKYIDKGEAKTFEFVMTNENGGTVDLTSASITCNFKESANASTNTFQKKNTAAGGSDSEVEVVSASRGIYLVKVNGANTLSLTRRTYYVANNVTISGVLYVQTWFLTINQNNGTSQTVLPHSGTTAEREALSLDSSNVGYPFYDTEDQTEYYWNGSDWV